MIIAKTVHELQSALRPHWQEGQIIGFVPTMGALHEGHISLVNRCASDSDVCVVSIFVNPTQFNNATDLTTYPRTLDHDLALLEPQGVSVVFAPSVEEVYPEPDTRQFTFGQLDTVMEGAFRPGHFNGVAQVVSRLFDLVKPTKAFFGEKDFQQVAIIRAMVSQLSLPIEIVAMPIVREADGLALSSRNTRLTPAQRTIAPAIYKALQASKLNQKNISVAEAIRSVTNEIDALPELKTEYFQIVDGNTLLPIAEWSDTNFVVGCIAVFCGEVRLIDNIIYFDNQ